jgi:hypothetical protein
MTRTALIALAGGTAIALAAPLAAQSTGPATAGQPAAAQPSAPAAAGESAVAPANSDDPNAQSTEEKADPKSKASGGTVVRAGPNAGMVIGGKAKKSKNDADAPQKADDQQSSDKCATNPCR